ncbi:MAG: tetratricopeptide repeat protein [Flavobacteriales bacterium]|nr:tetratricopeptide repeat protein [Flavobacteriales bacterium]
MLLLTCLLILCVQIAFPQSDSTAYRLGIEGIKLIDEGDFQEGINYLKKARKLEPEQYDYTFEIGHAYYLSGNSKLAEKYLYPLQYHVHVQPDLYILLAQCYKALNEEKKTPDESRKKELDALRYGVQKFPKVGSLQLELGKRNLEMEEPLKALSIFEDGIVNAPNFAENYFWAAKLLKATGNPLWTWIYAEVFFNLTENDEMKRTAAQLISESTEKVFSENWKADPESMDQELRFLLTSECKSINSNWDLYIEKRACLLDKWRDTAFPISVVIGRMAQLEEKGLLEPYLATIYLENDKGLFLPWVAAHAKEYETYRKWRNWNPITIKEPVKRL